MKKMAIHPGCGCGFLDFFYFINNFGIWLLNVWKILALNSTFHVYLFRLKNNRHFLIQNSKLSDFWFWTVYPSFSYLKIIQINMLRNKQHSSVHRGGGIAFLPRTELLKIHLFRIFHDFFFLSSKTCNKCNNTRFKMRGPVNTYNLKITNIHFGKYQW